MGLKKLVGRWLPELVKARLRPLILSKAEMLRRKHDAEFGFWLNWVKDHGSEPETAYYRKFQNQLSQERPTEIVIIDGLDPNWVTVMRYSDYAWRDIPDSWLQRDYLPRFKPE